MKKSKVTANKKNLIDPFKEAKTGDTVGIHFVGRISGTKKKVLFTEPDEPFYFTIGDKTTFKLINDAVIGMKLHEIKQVRIAPHEGFGEVDEQLIFEVPLKQLPKGIKPGTILTEGPEATQEWVVTEINKKTKIVTLNGNHPLAGQHMTFEIELIDLDPEIDQ